MAIRFGDACRIFGTALAFAPFIGCHRQLEEPDHPRVAAGVEMRDVRFYSSSLGREMPYRVFLPLRIPANRKLPVVYVLHGAGIGYRDWSDHSDISNYAREGLILVMPEGGMSYYMNSVESPKDKYEDYITKDLITDVEGRFPARPDRGGRAIVGISMGGFATVDYALVHSELYAFAGALSPSIDMPRRHFNIRRADQWWRMRTIFGPLGSEERAKRDPFELVQRVKPAGASYLYLTVGEQEPLLVPNRRFEARLKQYGFAHELHTKPGWHDWNQWNGQIPGCFESLVEHLSM